MKGPRFIVVGLGELLWDRFESGTRLGGAPANFAYHSLALGDRAFVVSRVGADEPGDQALMALDACGLGTRYIQIDSSHPTGLAEVKLDWQGQPEFVIGEGAAWDHIEFTEELKALAERTDAVCSGTLTQRAPTSRKTVREFLGSMKEDSIAVFDLNLRGSYYSADLIVETLELSNILRLNQAELSEVAGLLEFSGEDETSLARQFLEVFYLDLVCLTRGNEGCLIVGPDGSVEHGGFRTEVADTVGSGDAFTAAVIHHHLRGSPLDRMAEAANHLASWVASQSGAMPAPDAETVRTVTGVDA